jgi:hypothetical protein
MYCIAHINDELDAVLMGRELVVAGVGGWMDIAFYLLRVAMVRPVTNGAAGGANVLPSEVHRRGGLLEGADSF